MGKALGMNYSTEIVTIVAKIMSFFSFKKKKGNKKTKKKNKSKNRKEEQEDKSSDPKNGNVQIHEDDDLGKQQ